LSASPGFNERERNIEKPLENEDRERETTTNSTAAAKKQSLESCLLP
jgi:hypothetical protein